MFVFLLKKKNANQTSFFKEMNRNNLSFRIIDMVVPYTLQLPYYFYL